MKRNPASQSGLFNLRVVMAFALCSAGALLAAVSFAANPANGTLSDTSPVVTYTAGPFFVVNPTPVIELDSGPECNNPAQPCDDFALTVTLPTGYAAAHPGASIKATLSWNDTGSGNSDYDLYIYKNPRGDCTPDDCTVTTGSQAADYQSASSSNPEIAQIPISDGTQKYTVVVVPYTPTGESVNVRIELPSASGGGGDPNFGGRDQTMPGNPRYQNFYPPPGSARPSSGEFNIGFNPKTGRILTMNRGPVWRLTPPELSTPAKPECCEALWEDRSHPTTNFGLDPILWTDQKTGRTLISNSTVGANAVYAYSDNDGDLWVPFGIAAPNGGADHETLGSGPYPAALSALGTPVNQGEAVYYCSQDIVGPASCYRSDTLGASYGPSVLAYNGQGSSYPGGTCGGLHGHIHVAPDGTAWLPVNQCSGLQGGVFSTDGGITWNTFIVPNAISQIQGADPSIAIDSDSTIYYSYVNNEPVAAGHSPEGHARVAVGHLNSDNTITWSNDFDIGASHGMKNAAEIEAVGGSSGRAAVGFLGADVAGDYQAIGFPGKWYAFIATTYDGGKTWGTVNATPNDPVQSMTGVWQQGGSHQDRNLLDFNEITVDDRGRVLYGYSDGCVSTGCIAGTLPNDFVAYMRVARQTGGKSLYASNDATTDTTTALLPKPPCLSGTRDLVSTHLSWKAPDNGGADIVNYQIFRGTSSGSEVFLGQTGNTKTTFEDISTDPSVPDYFYVVKAINAVGTGPQSNEIDLPASSPQPPALPYSCSGTNIITDYAGDAVNPAPGGQGPTDQADITAISFSADTPATTITTTTKLANLTDIPSPGDAFTTYYVVWTSSDGKTYATEADVSPGPLVAYNWGEWDAANNRLANFNSATGTFNPGPNGTITVDVPLSGVGNPTIPITDVNGTPAVRNPYGLTIGGEGVAGSGVVWVQPMDRAPDADVGFGQNWAVCVPANNAPTAVLNATPTSGTPPLTVNFNGSGSYDPDNGDSVASYTFDFGDGSAQVTQSTPTISHTYSAAKNYIVHLRVADSHGLESTNVAQVVISVSLAAPKAKPASNMTGSGFTANWGAVNGATGYRLDVSTSKSFSNFVTGCNNLDVGNATNYNVTGLSPNTTYYYRVRAYSSSATSSNSNIITVKSAPTAPAAPTAKAATNITKSGFTANWNAVTGATGYRLDVSTSSSFSNFVTGYNNLDVKNATSRNVTGLKANTTYYYRVRAYNGGGTSPNSNGITVKTTK